MNEFVRRFIFVVFLLIACQPIRAATVSPAQSLPTLTSIPPIILTEGQLPSSVITSSPIPSAVGSDYILPSALEDQSIVEAIRLALAENIGTTIYDGQVFCSFALLKPLTENNENKVQAYMQSFCAEFYLKDNALQQGASIDLPVAMSLQKQDSAWVVDEFQRPNVGNWGPSIHKIFPPETLHLIFNSDYQGLARYNAMWNAIRQDNINQVIGYFGVPFMPTPTPAN